MCVSPPVSSAQHGFQSVPVGYSHRDHRGWRCAVWHAERLRCQVRGWCELPLPQARAVRTLPLTPQSTSRSVGSLVRAIPYGARRLIDHAQHGGEAPPKPDIPPTVREWYTPRDTDVIVSPPAKSGTTWLLHMAHQLRMNGADPTYDDQVREGVRRGLPTSPSHSRLTTSVRLWPRWTLPLGWSPLNGLAT